MRGRTWLNPGRIFIRCRPEAEWNSRTVYNCACSAEATNQRNDRLAVGKVIAAGEEIYRHAFLLSILFQVIHCLALPIVVTWDGFLYVDLADVIGTTRFPNDWDFLRTPLFPVLLKMAFSLLGKHALAVIGLNTLLGFLGVICLGHTIRRVGSPIAGALVIILLTFYPILITYQHCLLSDAGNFCCLAILISLFFWHPRSRYARTSALILGITFAYYFRPNLLYLSVVIGFLEGLRIVKARSHFEKSRRKSAIVQATMILLIPFVLAMPWKRLSYESRARQEDILCLGVFAQVVIPPDDELIGSAGDKYRECIRAGLIDGRLPMDGLRGSMQEIALERNRANNGISLASVFCKYPIRYLKGGIRTSLLFLGWPASSAENKAFRNFCMKTTRSDAVLLTEPPQLDPALREEFSQKSDTSIVARWLQKLDPAYDVLVGLGAIFTIIGSIVGFRRRDFRMLAFGLIPLGYLGMHVVILLSADRYGFPNYCIFLANLIAMPIWIWRPLSNPTTDVSYFVHT